MEKILSKYTYLFISSDNKFLIYNSQTNSFMEIYKELYINLLEAKNGQNLHLENINDKTKEILEKYKFLVSEEDDTNYFYQQKLASYIGSFSPKVLSLTLVPTTGCNFDCPYCFETHKKVKIMSNELIDDLITFIKKHINADSLNITWYGGEPLMAFSTMKKIMYKIKSETNLNLINHDIITNGYYFNKKVCDFFNEYSLNSIQITLDGDEISHNKKRKIKQTGKPTYQRIISNINLILKELPNTNLSIRVNIDKNNQESFYEVYKKLKEYWGENQRLHIYPGFIRVDDERNKQLSCESLQQKDRADFYFNLAEDHNLNIRFYPKLIKKGCSANRLNSYIIGPSGEIYKCWNDVSDTSKIVAYINQANVLNLSLLSKYMVGSNCFEDPECKECFFLPICSGGCPWYRMRNLFEKGEFNLCSIRKEISIFNRCLEKHFHSNHNMKYQINFS